MSPLCCKEYIFYHFSHKTRVHRTIVIADNDNSIWAALSNDGSYTAVSPIPYAHIYDLENDRQNATVFPISDGYNIANRAYTW